MLMAEPKTVVPTKAIRTDSSLFSPTSRLRNISSSISSTMKEVPETGSMPVSPITLTAIAPSRKVVNISTMANIAEGIRGKPPTRNVRIIAKNEITMKTGMWVSGHSYQPLFSMNSSPLSPVNAEDMSPKIEMNVGAILISPKIPPPRIAPIAIVLTTDENAFH